jgi:hypothetical protein
MKKEEVNVGEFYWMSFGLCNTYIAEAVAVADSKVSVMKIVSDDTMSGCVWQTDYQDILGPVRPQDLNEVRVKSKWLRIFR